MSDIFNCAEHGFGSRIHLSCPFCEVATLKSKLLLQFERGWDKGFTESQAKFATLQKDNDSLKADRNKLADEKAITSTLKSSLATVLSDLTKAEAEVERLRPALEWLVKLKKHKDVHGKTIEYIGDKNAAWAAAIAAINHKEK